MASGSSSDRADREEDLPVGFGALGGHWRRWRRALLGRSSSAPSTSSFQSLGDFAQKYRMEEILQVYPSDTPMSVFTGLLPQDLSHLTDPELRARVWDAVQAARLWTKRQDQMDYPSSVRRSLDVDGFSTGGSGGSSTSSSSAVSVSSSSSQIVGQSGLFLTARPRSFARQWSDDLRRRRETFAAPSGHPLSSAVVSHSAMSSSARHSVGLFSLPLHSSHHGLNSGFCRVAVANSMSSSTSGETSNLLRMRNSTLGQSAPSLTASSTNLGPCLTRANSEATGHPPYPSGAAPASTGTATADAGIIQAPVGSIQTGPSASNAARDLILSRRCSRGAHRKSLMATSPTLPRCHSPLSQGSPLESPRNMSPSQQFAFVPIKKAECRRWSVASLPSSGYGTTPASSNVSSQCSSQERLNHLPTEPTAEEMRFLSRHFSSNESHVKSGTKSTSGAGPVTEDGDGPNSSGRRSPMTPMMRPRSRSLSSPVRSPVVDSEVVMMNMLYKERFPKATQQMEERLKAFIEEHEAPSIGSALADLPADAIAIVRFVQHQVVELARDCLQKSRQQLVTSRYFYEMSDNLERLLGEAKEKSTDAVVPLGRVVRKLLLIISRPARLLECLEFDPEEFYHMLEEAEGQVRVAQGVVTDFPQYIVSQLGLNRDPLAELQKDLSQLEDSCSSPLPTQPSTDHQQMTTSTPNAPKRRVDVLPKEEDYEVVKLISNGAYGAVYLVRHRETRQRFAMKKINKQNMILRNQIEQAFAERDILCFTDNPFVVSLQCTFETKKHLCMVMEYVEGGDCATLLKNMGPFPCDMAKFYFSETVLAVEYLHSYGIVHRDLKPDNLLITTLGHIKLTDFGLSKMGLMSLATNLYEVGFIDRETREFSDKQVFGTPEYIAPEVVLRQGYGKPVDWWAMGIILYEFLIGCVPFFGETPEELFSHVVNDDIEWPLESDWPVQPEAKDLITALLQQNPRDRLGTAGGGTEIKMHPFFDGLDWNSLLRQKAEFIPQLDDDEDTSYFDTRADRYCHDVGEDDTDGDLDETAHMFASFSSCSPRYRKSHGLFLLQNNSAAAGGSLNDSGASDQSTESVPAGLNSEVEPVVHPAGAPESTDAEIQAQTPSESSQTENESESSPQLQRRRRLHRELKSLPRFSISVDDSGRSNSIMSTPDHIRELSPVDEGDRTSGDLIPVPTVRPAETSSTTTGGARPKSNNLSVSPCLSGGRTSSHHRSRTSVIKSNSTSGLSLMIPSDDGCIQSQIQSVRSIQSPGGSSSTASSRDASPCRELSPMINSLKPPVILRRGPRGFGFTLRAIRVYLGDSDFYTVHHLVMAVDEGSPAFEAGLRPGDLITHINGEPVQGLFHTQVLQLMLSEGDRVTLRATPLDQTSIRTGGRKREPNKSRLARRAHYRHGRRGAGGATRASATGSKAQDSLVMSRDSVAERRRKTSLFRRLSNKRASAEIIQQQSFKLQSPVTAPILPRGSLNPFLLAASSSGASSPVLTPSRSFQSLSRSLPATIHPLMTVAPESGANSPPTNRLAHSPPILRNASLASACSGAMSPSDSAASSSPSSSSPSSTTPNSPASGLNLAHPASGFARPSSLHGLKNKLHSVAKNMHSPSRRKSAGHIPLSPLARTPSPSPQPNIVPGPVSPTRSPSPLAFPLVHQPGSSHSTQVFSPGASLSVSPAAKRAMSQRPKSAEPGSPLLRRALSPDRLHPRSAEKNLGISPLCSNGSNGSGNVNSNINSNENSNDDSSSNSRSESENQPQHVPKVTVISPPRVTILSNPLESSGPPIELTGALGEVEESEVELRKPLDWVDARQQQETSIDCDEVGMLAAAAAASNELRRRKSPTFKDLPHQQDEDRAPL